MEYTEMAKRSCTFREFIHPSAVTSEIYNPYFIYIVSLQILGISIQEKSLCLENKLNNNRLSFPVLLEQVNKGTSWLDFWCFEALSYKWPENQYYILPDVNNKTNEIWTSNNLAKMTLFEI